MTTPAAAEPRTAHDLIVEAIIRLRTTDPTETDASLLAAWHGFGTAEAAGAILAQDNPNDAVRARNARPIMATLAALLRAAPSMPYADVITETVEGLIPGDLQAATDDHAIAYPDPVPPVDQSAAGIVRSGILMLALELNTLLPQAAENAVDLADRIACEHCARLAGELDRCWEGRLGSFVNTSSDLSTPRHASQQPGECSSRNKT